VANDFAIGLDAFGVLSPNSRGPMTIPDGKGRVHDKVQASLEKKERL
jgi:hypothetical protein